MTVTDFDTSKLSARLQGICDDTVRSGSCFGLIFRLLQGGNVISEVSAGVEDPDTNRPVTADTMFRLASMTKPVTAAAILSARDQGLLSLYDPVSKYLPAFDELWLGKRGENPDGTVAFVRDRKCTEKLRIWNLITHTNGLGAGELGYDAQWRIPRKYRQSLATIADYVPENFPLDFDPGTRLSYSTTLGGDIAGRVIEIASGKEFGEFIKENLLDPIGAVDITFEPSDEQRTRFMRMIDRDSAGVSFADDSLGLSTFENLPLTYHSGGASLTGSLNSYTRFAQMLRSDGVLNGVRVLSAASARLLHTPWIAPGTEWMAENESWGLMVRIITGPHPYLPEGVYGWSGAYGTYFWIDPANDIVGILMRNSRFEGCQDSPVALKLERAVYEEIKK